MAVITQRALAAGTVAVVLASTLAGSMPPATSTATPMAHEITAASGAVRKDAGLECLVVGNVQPSDAPNPSRRCVRRALTRVGATRPGDGLAAAILRYKRRWMGPGPHDTIVRRPMVESLGLRWGDRHGAGVSWRTSAGHTAWRLGCVRHRRTDQLDSFFAGRLGPSIGQDAAHIYPLPGAGRFLWLFNDSFMDHTGTALTRGRPASRYVHNIALVQQPNPKGPGACFRLLHHGTATEPRAFELGDGTSGSHWFWPMGGGMDAEGRLVVFWAEMRQDCPARVDRRECPGTLNGVRRSPVGVWVAGYDPSTLAQRFFRPAPNPGARSQPLYGWQVQHTPQWTYLYGNSYVHNLSVEGGYTSCPCSATKMLVARVPRGRFLTQPAYWDGSRWVSDPEQAAPISDRFWTQNGMQPRRLRGPDGASKWVSVTAENEYLGSTVVIDVASRPHGPWRTARQHHVTDFGIDTSTTVTYKPILLPWLDLDGQLQMVLSKNCSVHNGVERPAFCYRPRVASLSWPLLDPDTDAGITPSSSFDHPDGSPAVR